MLRHHLEHQELAVQMVRQELQEQVPYLVHQGQVLLLEQVELQGHQEVVDKEVLEVHQVQMVHQEQVVLLVQVELQAQVQHQELQEQMV